TGSTQTDQHPVVNVSLHDAKAFCQWLTDESRKRGEAVHYRLPTDAEMHRAKMAPRTASLESEPDGAEQDFGSQHNILRLIRLTLELLAEEEVTAPHPQSPRATSWSGAFVLAVHLTTDPVYAVSNFVSEYLKDELLMALSGGEVFGIQLTSLESDSPEDNELLYEIFVPEPVESIRENEPGVSDLANAWEWCDTVVYPIVDMHLTRKSVSAAVFSTRSSAQLLAAGDGITRYVCVDDTFLPGGFCTLPADSRCFTVRFRIVREPDTVATAPAAALPCGPRESAAP
ncbi:MAG: SUMF1/EgtB/PvdO family nonheme iron enzyme, partial [Planctomyces sp.]